MKTKPLVIVSGALLLPLGICLWLGWPVYQFFAFRGEVPMLPWGYVTVPHEGPGTQIIDDDRYQVAATQSLETLSRHRQTIQAPAISAAVAIDGKRVWAGSVGWADIGNKIAATPDTRFRIGSTSKPLTITALAKLVEKGALDLDTTIDHYLTELSNPEWKSITPRHLASHMAGLVDYQNTAEWTGLYQVMALQTHYDNVQDSLTVFDGTPLTHPPGSHYEYTSYSTVLLSAVMQGAARTPYQQLIQKSVFDPLGMHQTSPDPGQHQPDMAQFYWREGTKAKIWRQVDLSHRMAGGGLVSTPSDLVKLGSAWLDDDFITPDIRHVFWQPQRLNNGEVNPQNYALGWRMHTGDDYMVTNFNHGGVSRGAQCWLMVIPEYRMVVAVSINTTTEVFWDFGEVGVIIARQFAEPD